MGMSPSRGSGSRKEEDQQYNKKYNSPEKKPYEVVIDQLMIH